MKRTPLLCLLFLAGAVGACSDSGESPPPSSSAKKGTTPTSSFANIAVNPDATWTTNQQRDTVKIFDDKLIFPLQGNADLLKKKAGDILVSDRSKKGNNPYGFMRKVVSVSKQADTIEMKTAQAYLDDVIVGKFEIAAEPTDLTLLTPEELGQSSPQTAGAPDVPGLKPQDESDGFGLDLGKEVSDIKLFEFKVGALKVPVGSKELEVGIGGDAKVSKAGFHFKPSIRIGADIAVPGGFLDKFSASNYLQEFHVITKGEISAHTTLSGKVGVSAGFPELWKTDPDTSPALRDLHSKVLNEIAKTKQPNLPLTIPVLDISVAGPPIPTPIPIPVIYKFELVLACGASINAGVELDVGFSGSTMAELGGIYEKDKGWRGVSDFNMQFNKVGPNWKANGGVEVKCALEPKFTPLVAGAVGPFLKLSAYGSAKVEYKQDCPLNTVDVPPKPSIAPGFEAGMDVFLGGELNIFGKYKVGEAQVALFNKVLLKLPDQLPGNPNLSIPLPDSWAIGWCSSTPCDSTHTPEKNPECFAGAGGGGQGGNGSGATNQGGNGSGATNQGGNGSGATNSGGNGTGATNQGGNGSGASGQGGSGQTAVCGNGKVDSATEFCDGNDFDGKTCADYKGNPNATGPLKCNKDCTVDTSSCDVGAVCGDVCTPAMTPQKPECGSCQQKVCAANDYCCNDKWDAVCVNVAKTLCGMCN